MCLLDPQQLEEKKKMYEENSEFTEKNKFIYTFSTAIKRSKTITWLFVMSNDSLWHDLRLEMSLNSHFNHIHVIIQNSIFIYHQLTKQFRGFKSETSFFSFSSTSKSHGNMTILFQKQNKTTTFEEPANIYYESIIINVHLNEICIHCRCFRTSDPPAAHREFCQHEECSVVLDPPDGETASLSHSHLLYIPDRRQGVHSLRRVQRSVHVRGADRARYRQWAHRARVTVHGTPTAVRLTQLLLDQFPLLGSAVLEPDFHLEVHNW